jgi:hypothetical protein
VVVDEGLSEWSGGVDEEYQEYVDAQHDSLVDETCMPRSQ